MEETASQRRKVCLEDDTSLTALLRPSKKPAGSGLTPFALRLAKQFAEDRQGKNLVFSPLSIYAALALVATGARGQTLDEFLTVLSAASRDELAEFVRHAAECALGDRSELGGPLVAYACGVWHDQRATLKPAYRAAAVESYKAETRAADFKSKYEEARVEINSWVSKATNELIASILPEGSVHPRTTLVLANCIYFKGKWSKPFATEDTKDRPFYRLDGTHVSAPFMQSSKDQFVTVRDGFKVLKMPYINSSDDDGRNWRKSDKSQNSDDECSRFSMCIFLPDTHDGLPSLLDKMESNPSFLQDHLPTHSVRVGEFVLPKFKLSFYRKMNDVAMEMGIKAAFSDVEADFSDMFERGSSLTLDNVFHKAVIEVNEEGTEAAASTVCTMRYKCKRPSPVDFIADHPFAFFMVEEGGCE
ncbi:hypothetical protein EJB05_30559, partial [Eragrostis curvula]